MLRLISNDPTYLSHKIQSGTDLDNSSLLEGAMHITRGEKESIICSCEPYALQ